jgi:hypothetical protein
MADDQPAVPPNGGAAAAVAPAPPAPLAPPAPVPQVRPAQLPQFASFVCEIDPWAQNPCSDPEAVPGWPFPSTLLVALGSRRGGPWIAGLGAAIISTVIALGAHLSVPGMDHRLTPLLVGAVLGVAVGVALAFVARTANAACNTYPDQVQELVERVREAVGKLRASPISKPEDLTTASTISNLLCGVLQKLEQQGPEWLDASGFLDCWNAVHEAEANLLLIAPDNEVISAALYDLLRLTGSSIAGRDALASELRTALPLLSDAAAVQVNQPAGGTHTPAVARARIRTVRIAVEQDREQQWDQIVRSRNGLLTAGVVALGIAYALVVLAVGFSAAPGALGSALVFALVGAVVSGTYQLQFRSNATNDVEDFGFTTVKIVVVPILAGIVAVLAIVFLTQFQLIISGQTLGGSFTSWQAIFDWRHNPSALATAIIFGFAPSLFFSLLQSKVDNAMKSIKSSQPSGGGN